MMWQLVVIAVVVVAAIMSYNSLVRLRETSEAAWADIDVQLKRRYDVIPNIVETVKGYAKHEKETLESVVAARSGAVSAQYEDADLPERVHRPLLRIHGA
jgi:LemA protein